MIEIGDRVTEEQLLSLGESEVYLKNIEYSLNEKYGYSTINGEIGIINKCVDKCRLGLSTIDKTRCIYRIDKKDTKDLHIKKVKDGINNLVSTVIFLTKAWDIDIEKIKDLSKKYGIFEYIVRYTDYYNSISLGEIECDVNNYIKEQGCKESMYMCIDEYDVPVEFDSILCNWMSKLCLEYDWNINSALYKILDTKVFKEIEYKIAETLSRYDKKEDKILWYKLSIELGLEC